MSLETASQREYKNAPRRGKYQTLRIERYEWAQVRADALEMGLRPSAFVVQLWRNWRASRWPLSVLGPLPRDPWVGKKEVDSEVKR